MNEHDGEQVARTSCRPKVSGTDHRERTIVHLVAKVGPRIPGPIFTRGVGVQVNEGYTIQRQSGCQQAGSTFDDVCVRAIGERFVARDVGGPNTRGIDCEYVCGDNFQPKTFRHRFETKVEDSIVRSSTTGYVHELICHISRTCPCDRFNSTYKADAMITAAAIVKMHGSQLCGVLFRQVAKRTVPSHKYPI